MLAEIFLSAGLAAIMTVAGAIWIDKLYGTCADLSFPEKIPERSKFRRPILFCGLSVSNWLVFTTINMPEKFFILAAIFLLVLMTVTDFEQYMLFDAMTLPFAIIGAIYALQGNFLDCAAAAIIGGGIFFGLAILSNGSLGGGDIKLVAALGLWLGCEKLLNSVLIATIFGGLAALMMILLKQKDRGSYLAYGPYFALSAIYILLTD